MARKLSPESVVAIAQEQLTANIGEESVILNMKKQVYYGLQGVGVRVWQLMQKPQRVAELRDALLEEFDVEPARCEHDLLELLAKLLAEGMIELQAGETD